MPTVATIEDALSHGRVEAAQRAAVEYLHGAQPGDPRLAEVTAVLRGFYNDFLAEPVERFLAWADNQPFGAALRQGLKPELELTREWEGRLRNLANERLANRLTDTVKANDMAAAEQAAANLLASATGPEDSARRARQVGSILGGLVHEKDRALGLVRSITRHPTKYGLDPMSATDMEEEFNRAQASAVRRERQVGATSRVELTQSAVELSRGLPGRMAIHEPNEEDLDKFRALLRAMFRAGLLSPGHELLHEATNLLVEFSPKEVSAAGALAGVERRLHASLGRTARIVGARVLKEAGASPNLYKPYEAFARRILNTRNGRFAVEVLGLLQNPAALPMLHELMRDPRSPLRQEAAFALGAIGGDKALHTLTAALKADLTGKVIEGEKRRDAVIMLTAIGRSARSMPAADRSRLISQVAKAVPRDDSEFVIRILLNYFTGKLDGFDPGVLDWAAKSAVAALWKLENPELARRAGQSALGFRQPLVDLLERLAPHVAPTIHDSITAALKQYSAGAYLAAAEFYAKDTPARAGGTDNLRQMLFNVRLHDHGAPKSAYQREMTVDAATDEVSEISGDKVIGAIIYAASQAGTEEAEAFLSEMFQQVQSGQMPRLGQETSTLLMDAHMRASKRAGKSAFAPLPGSAAEPPPEPGKVTEDDARMLEELQASYILPGKRRQKKVAAMQGLAQNRIVASVAPIVSHLTDKDSIVAGAAMTAVLDIVRPPVHPDVQGKVHDALLGALATGDNATRVKVAGILRKLGVGKSPLKERIEALAARPGLSTEARAVIVTLTGTAQAQQKAAASTAADDQPAAPEVDPNVGKFLPSKAAAAGQLSTLDKKRAYMLARQEWVRGGKKGPEPQMPE